MKKVKKITWKNIVESNISLFFLLIILSLLCIPLIFLILKFKVLTGIFGTFVVSGIVYVAAAGFSAGMNNLLNALSKLHNN